MTDMQMIPVRSLKAAPDNPRRSPGDVAELAASIKTAGVLEPLVVCPNGKGYEVVIGTRRLAAAKAAGLTEVPVIVREMDPKTRAEAMLIENLQRDDLLPTEEAGALQRLLDVGGYSQRTLASRIGRSQAWVSKRLGLLSLPDKVRADVDSGRITLTDAEALLPLVEHPERLKRALSPQGYNARIIDAAHREVEEIEREAKRAAATEKAKAGKVPYVEPTKLDGLPDGVEYVNDWSAIPQKGHEKLACHAVTVGRSGDLRAVCTDPASHPETKEPENEDGVDWRTGQARDTERDKALSAAKKARAVVIAEALPGRHTREEALSLLVQSVIRNAGQNPKQVACKLLQIDAPKGEYNRDFAAGLSAYAAESEPNMLRVALALALGWTEDMLGSWGGWTHTEEHFAFLKAYGHKITPAEREQIKKGGRS